MDLGGANLVLIEVVGVLLLGAFLLYMVTRIKSRGKQDNTVADDRETRQRYADAEAERKSHPEDDD